MEGTNKRKKRLLGLGIGDVVLLLLILCGIGLGVWYLRGTRGGTEQTVQVEYAIRMPETALGQLPSAEIWHGSVTDESGRRSMGDVVEIALRPGQKATVREGKVVFAEIPDVAEPVITVRAEARLIDGRELRLGELRLAAGMQGSFLVGGFLMTNAEILWVEVLE